jgi:cytochrome b6-f complex iron-sulfur subunit
MTTSHSNVPSRLDPDPVPRRDFLGLASMWAAGTTFLFAAIGSLRLPKAAVLSSPSRKFRVTLPDNLPEGTPFLPPGRSVAIFKDEQGVYAISTICTHLGCVVKPSPTGFDCPCHGSKFRPDGTVLKGPAPTALPWNKVSVDGSVCIVDEEAKVPPGTKV